MTKLSKYKILAFIVFCFGLFFLTGCDNLGMPITKEPGFSEFYSYTDQSQNDKVKPKESCSFYIGWFTFEKLFNGQIEADDSLKSHAGLMKLLTGDEEFTTSKGVMKWAENMKNTLAGDGSGNLAPAHIVSSSLTELSNLFSGSSTNSEYQSVYNQLNKIFDSIIGMCCALLVIFWGINFLGEFVRQQFSPETFVASLTRLMAGLIVVANSDLIVRGLLDLGNMITINIGSSVSTESSSSLLSWVSLKQASGLYIGINIIGDGLNWYIHSGILAVLAMLIPWVLCVWCAIQIVSALIFRTFEMFGRIVLAPVSLSVSASDGMGQPLMHFFSGTLACAVQPILIEIGVLAFPAIKLLIGSVFKGFLEGNSVFGDIFSMGICYFILAIWVSKTEQVSKGIFGGH